MGTDAENLAEYVGAHLARVADAQAAIAALRLGDLLASGAELLLRQQNLIEQLQRGGPDPADDPGSSRGISDRYSDTY